VTHRENGGGHSFLFSLFVTNSFATAVLYRSAHRQSLFSFSLPHFLSFSLSLPFLCSDSRTSSTMLSSSLSLFLSLLFLSLCLLSQPASSGRNFAGADSFFLYALSSADRLRHLSAMSEAQVKVLRIFITGVGKGSKGTSAQDVADVEPKTLGVWDDTVLSLVDRLMLESAWYGIKLDISMHDRYSLGCWAKDAYFYEYHFPDGTGQSCNAQKNDARQFYMNETIEKVFDNRLIHLLEHKNPFFNDRPWGQLSEAVFTFAAENESQGYIPVKDFEWACRRAVTMKAHMGRGVLVSINGATVDDSLQPAYFACPQIDLVGVHNYASGNSREFARNYSAFAVAAAKQSGKRTYVEEFGATGPDGQKAAGLAAQMAGMLDAHISFMPWEILDCHPPLNDNEFFNGTLTWNQFLTFAQRTTNDVDAPFDFPELHNPPSIGFAAIKTQCSVHSDCATSCCSSHGKCALPSDCAHIAADFALAYSA